MTMFFTQTYMITSHKKQFKKMPTLFYKENFKQLSSNLSDRTLFAV